MKHLLSCDWGTSTFRLRVLDTVTGEILEEIKSDDGIRAVHTDWSKGDEHRIQFFKKRLANALKELKFELEADSPIILSGMASSSMGILELPYQPLPVALSTDMPVWRALVKDDHLPHPIYLVSGVSTGTDVMRGEETMLMGIDNSAADEICILPGTHSKHAYVKSGVLTDFKTYVTGELFNVMTQYSLLSQSVMAGEDTKAFEAGVEEAASGNLLNQFFKVRTRHLLNKTSGVNNYQFLSGLLIGTELRELKNASGKIRLISDGALQHVYAHALQQLGLPATIASATQCLINGHLQIFKRIGTN